MKFDLSKKNQKVALIALILVAVLLALLLIRSRHSKTAAANTRFEARYEKTIDDLRINRKILRKKMEAGIPGLQNILPQDMLPKQKMPSTTELAEESEPPDSEINLRGIYWSQTMPLAEINGKLRKLGDTVAGHTVEEIHPYSVILSNSEGVLSTNSLIGRK